MKQNNWGRISLFMGIFELLLGFLLVASLSGNKDTWEYYLSSSHRSNVDAGSTIGWLIIAAGVVELIYGIIVLAAGEQRTSISESMSESTECVEWLEGEIIKKEWDPAEHQIERFVVLKKDDSTVKIWRHTSSPVTCKVGDRGWFRTKDGQMTEYISAGDVY